MMLKRDSGIELLRIISMIIIIMHHFSVHSQFVFPLNELSPNRIFVQLMALGGKIGVDCFVLISGFFLIKKEFNLFKLIKLIAQIWFYSLLIVSIFIFFDLPIKNYVRYFVPVYSVNWFAYVYIILYVLHPFINKMLCNLNKVLYLKMLICMTVMWCIFNWGLDAPMQYSNIIWFIYMYSIGAYIRLYGEPEFKIYRNILLGTLGLWMGIIIFDYIGENSSYILSLWPKQYAQNSPFVLIISINMFLLFRRVKIGYNKYINGVASTVFGIYLIHDNPLIRGVIWTSILGNASMSENDLLWLIALSEVLVIFVMCSAIDFLRQYVVNAIPTDWLKTKTILLEDKINNILKEI